MSHEKGLTSTNESADVSESKRTKSNIAHGRKYDDEGNYIMNKEEQAEYAEFITTTKKYNDIAKKLRRKAIRDEKNELISMEKSPVRKYYVDSKLERIKILDGEKALMKEMEASAKAKNK